MALGDMGANIRVQRVPWHPAQRTDNAPFTGAAPVRTVHYILNAIGVRHYHRMSLRVRRRSAQKAGQLTARFPALNLI